MNTVLTPSPGRWLQFVKILLVKTCFLILLLTLDLLAFSQKKKKESKPTYVYYVDSVRMRSEPIIDFKNIDSANIVYDSDTSAPDGKVYITTKNHSKFLTTRDLDKIYRVTPDSPAIYMLDEHIVMDTSLFALDSSYIGKVEVETVTQYHPKFGKVIDLRFVKIFTQDYIDEKNRKRKKKKNL